MAHGIVRTDNMAGTVLGEYLVSVEATADIDNGSIVVVGGLKEGEREVRSMSTPATDSVVDTLALIASEEVDPESNTAVLGAFYNKSGSVMRGYKLHKGDIFSVTADCFTTSIVAAAGTSVLEAAASVKPSLVNSATGATVIAKLIAIEAQGATTWYVFQV